MAIPHLSREQLAYTVANTKEINIDGKVFTYQIILLPLLHGHLSAESLCRKWEPLLPSWLLEMAKFTSL
jgi:hypothetical protein